MALGKPKKGLTFDSGPTDTLSLTNVVSENTIVLREISSVPQTVQTTAPLTLNMAPLREDLYNIQSSGDTLIEQNAIKKRNALAARMGITPEIMAGEGEVPVQLDGTTVSSGTGIGGTTTIAGGTTITTGTGNAPAVPSVSTMEEVIRRLTSAELSDYIDASRAANLERKANTYPRLSLGGVLPEFNISTGYTLAPGQSPNAIPPALSSNLPDAVKRARFPEVIMTDAYLNDPIQFETDPRLYRDSVVKEMDSGSLTQYPRDIASFVTVPLGTTPRVYSIATTSNMTSRINVERYINYKFEEF